jgi:2-deoxy-D-gluconate 3-dehydrogenase
LSGVPTVADDIFAGWRLDGRTAIVTGGAGLLGSGFCRMLAAAGAAVAVLDLDLRRAETVAGRIVEEGGEALAAEVDVTEVDSVRKAVARAEDALAPADILVNCAAQDPKFDPTHRVASSNAFEDYPLKLWEDALRVDLTGMFLMTQAVCAGMARRNRGSIVNICSTYGLVGPDQRLYQRDGQPAQFKPVYYSVTKAGVLGFTRYLATYYARTGIRVNALTPGGVFQDHEPDFVERYSARTVLGRMADKDEMNGALLFLASDASSYMTGSNLVVDGGWTAW